MKPLSSDRTKGFIEKEKERYSIEILAQSVDGVWLK